MGDGWELPSFAVFLLTPFPVSPAFGGESLRAPVNPDVLWYLLKSTSPDRSRTTGLISLRNSNFFFSLKFRVSTNRYLSNFNPFWKIIYGFSLCVNKTVWKQLAMYLTEQFDMLGFWGKRKRMIYWIDFKRSHKSYILFSNLCSLKLLCSQKPTAASTITTSTPTEYTHTWENTKFPLLSLLTQREKT